MPRSGGSAGLTRVQFLQCALNLLVEGGNASAQGPPVALQLGNLRKSELVGAFFFIWSHLVCTNLALQIVCNQYLCTHLLSAILAKSFAKR